MAAPIRQFLVAALLIVFCAILQSYTSNAARIQDVKYAADGKEERQWDMSFPYLLMMMSNASTMSPSLWLVPVVIASCIMLFIRGTMN